MGKTPPPRCLKHGMGEFQDRLIPWFQQGTALGNEMLENNRPGNKNSRGKSTLRYHTVSFKNQHQITNHGERTKSQAELIREAEIKINSNSHCKLLVKSLKWQKKLKRIIILGKITAHRFCANRFQQDEGKKYKPSGFLQYLLEQMRENPDFVKKNTGF